MALEFPSPVPEIRVSNLTQAATYYEKSLGFHWDWGVEGIAQLSRDSCRVFLTDDTFLGDAQKWTPGVNWLNLGSKTEVDELHEAWSKAGALTIARPESKLWNLYEFTVADLDGNLFRVFYDFAWELADRGGRRDGKAERDAARARL